jgi:hypothetical protein
MSPQSLISASLEPDEIAWLKDGVVLQEQQVGLCDRFLGIRQDVLQGSQGRQRVLRVVHPLRELPVEDGSQIAFLFIHRN